MKTLFLTSSFLLLIVACQNLSPKKKVAAFIRDMECREIIDTDKLLTLNDSVFTFDLYETQIRVWHDEGEVKVYERTLEDSLTHGRYYLNMNGERSYKLIEFDRISFSGNFRQDSVELIGSPSVTVRVNNQLITDTVKVKSNRVQFDIEFWNKEEFKIKQFLYQLSLDSVDFEPTYLKKFAIVEKSNCEIEKQSFTANIEFNKIYNLYLTQQTLGSSKSFGISESNFQFKKVVE